MSRRNAPEIFFFPRYGVAHGRAQEQTPGSAVKHCRFLDTGGGGDCISLGDIRFLPTRSIFTFFQTFLNFWSNEPKCRHLKGGMCMLFEICEKTPFQKCMGWGPKSSFQGLSKYIPHTPTFGTLSGHK